MVYLGFYEMPEDDQPKFSIWGHPELLEEWFKNLKERRENPGTEKVSDEWADFDGAQNELTKEYRR